jgi:hypothetical protein
MSDKSIYFTDMNRQPIKHIDATPDDGYPLRILEAYRRDCDMWCSSSTNLGDPETNPLCIAMNEMQKKRAVVLDKAIAKLREAI